MDIGYKFFISNLFIFHVFIFLIGTTSCTSLGTRGEGEEGLPQLETPSKITLEQALNKWEEHEIYNYEITVDMFASSLPPPCSMKATLVVEENELIAIREIATPVPVGLTDGELIFNQLCYEYERFIVLERFIRLENILSREPKPPSWDVQFNEEYGYIEELNIYYGGEAMERVVYSDFVIR